jgi:hypothetical protein
VRFHEPDDTALDPEKREHTEHGPEQDADDTDQVGTT